MYILGSFREWKIFVPESTSLEYFGVSDLMCMVALSGCDTDIRLGLDFLRGRTQRHRDSLAEIV